jgi:signal transduction histidine kinase
MVMSHELRTPLNAILGYTEMLIEGVGGEVPPDPDEQAVDLWRIRGAGSHLLALIDDILHMTRLESGAVVLERSRVAVAPFLRDLGAVMREQLARPDLEFVVEVDEALGEIETDTARLRHILRHLLRNAAKFTPRGSIGLRASRRGEWLHLEVRDTGIGIAAEHLGRLFAPFVQIDDSPTRRYGGLGLGLALCRRYCDELGAELSVESQVQRGSVFFVRVPVAPIARAPL